MYGNYIKLAQDQAHAKGTKRQYGYGERWWRLFHAAKGYNPFHHHARIWEQFVAWRFFGHGVRVGTIKQNFSAIRSWFIKNNYEPAKWSTWHGLDKLFKGLERIQPVKDFTAAITRKIIVKMKRSMKRNNWTNISFMVMVVLAYCLALRPQDYTVTKSSPTLTWQNLIFNHSEKSITIRILKSKMNQKGPPEIVSFFCPCTPKSTKLCAYCTMKCYKKACPDSSGSHCVFTKFGKNKYRPFDYNRYLDIFGEYMVLLFGNDYDSSIYRPHSLRYGRATDLALAGIPDHVIRRVTRHAAKSKTLFRYINMSPQTVGETIKLRELQLKLR